MHEKYTTSAFVVSSRPSGEADKIITLYTEEFGLISALLTGVRNAKSKFKGFTESGLYVCVTLIRGRNIWRATDLTMSSGSKLTKPNLVVFLKLLVLLRRLVQGEERNQALFEVLTSVFLFLLKRIHSSASLDAIELLGAARILSVLGYGSELPKNISIEGNIHESDLIKVADQKKMLRDLINHSLTQSQLVSKSDSHDKS